VAKLNKLYTQENDLLHDKPKGARVKGIVNPNKKAGPKKEEILANKHAVKAVLVEHKKQSIDSKKNYVSSAAAELEDLKQLLSKSHSKAKLAKEAGQNFVNKQAVIEEAMALMKEHSRRRRSEAMGISAAQNLDKEQEKKREADISEYRSQVKQKKVSNTKENKDSILAELDDVVEEKSLPQIRVKSRVEVKGKANFKPNENLLTAKGKNPSGFQKG
jgi:hypothetical protein